MDQRDYGVGVQILRYLGVSKIRLISNNPRKRVGLIRIWIGNSGKCSDRNSPDPHNEKYLQTKRDKLGQRFCPPVPEGTEITNKKIRGAPQNS